MAGKKPHPYPQPDGREPAPGRLAVVQDFANAHFSEAREEDRERPAEPILTWARPYGLLPRGAQLSSGDVARLLELRRLLREAIAANHGEQPMSPDDVRKLNDIARESAVHVHFDAEGGLSLESKEQGVDGLAAKMFAIIAEARRDGTWARLKICGASDCQWAFYDRSKNGSGAWCSMSDCGNRAKAKAFRERKRSPA